MAGFVPAAEAEGWELVPTIWCAASPSAHVTRDAYERVAKTMVDGIAASHTITDLSQLRDWIDPRLAEAGVL